MELPGGPCRRPGCGRRLVAGRVAAVPAPGHEGPAGARRRRQGHPLPHRARRAGQHLDAARRGDGGDRDRGPARLGRGMSFPAPSDGLAVVVVLTPQNDHNCEPAGLTRPRRRHREARIRPLPVRCRREDASAAPPCGPLGTPGLPWAARAVALAAASGPARGRAAALNAPLAAPQRRPGLGRLRLPGVRRQCAALHPAGRPGDLARGPGLLVAGDGRRAARPPAPSKPRSSFSYRPATPLPPTCWRTPWARCWGPCSRRCWTTAVLRFPFPGRG